MFVTTILDSLVKGCLPLLNFARGLEKRLGLRETDLVYVNTHKSSKIKKKPKNFQLFKGPIHITEYSYTIVRRDGSD